MITIHRTAKNRVRRRWFALLNSTAGAGGVVPPDPPSDTLRVATGTYTGTGARQNVDLPFTPDLVFVWGNGQKPRWKNRTAWHGRSQALDNTGSAHIIAPKNGAFQNPFNSAGFAVDAIYAASGATYNYAAIRLNGTANIAETSIIGNQTAGRDVVFADFTPDETLIKRDSTLSGVMTLTGQASKRMRSVEAAAAAVTYIAGGVQLGAYNWVNQNNGAALGEGIEIIAAKNAGNVTATKYTGDGAATKALPFGGDFAVIVPYATSGGDAVVVSAAGASDIVGVAVPGVSMTPTAITVPTALNTSGAEYLVMAFRDSGAAIAPPDSPALPANCGKVVPYALGTLTNALSVSGPASYEFWLRPHYEGQKWFTPLLMNGDGADQGTAGYNLGAYLYGADPDGNGWVGGALRVINSKYLARERVAPNDSINRYNMNTGIVFQAGDPMHVVVTHDGAGHWRVYMDGELVKDHNRSMTLETGLTDGGEGIAHPLYVLGAMLGAVQTGSGGDVFRVQTWAQELTRAHALDLHKELMGTKAWAGPAATQKWDFRGGTLPSGVTGITMGAPGTPGQWFPEFLAGTASASAGRPDWRADGGVDVVNPAGATNGRVWTRLPAGVPRVLRSRIAFGDATRIFARMSDTTGGAAGTTIWDLTRAAPGEIIDRTDTITATAAQPYLHFVGITTQNQRFTIHPETYLARL